MIKPTLNTYSGLAPSRLRPSTFSADGDQMMLFMANLPAQINPALDYVEYGVETVSSGVSTMEDALVEVQAASQAATQIADVWVSGAQYQQGDVVWSQTSFGTYRARVTHTGETTDPALDSVNWAPLSSGDHVEREDNPHNVTAGQVGAYTQDEVDQALAVAIAAHEELLDNPHNVTASQVGSYTRDEVDALLAASGLGVGQSWQNVTASRNGYTTYQNTTDRPISVHVSVYCFGFDGDGLILRVGDSPGQFTEKTTNLEPGYGGEANYMDSTSGRIWLEAIVPPGHYYEVVPTYGGSLQWLELR